ncbi:MAG: peptide chain release factor N(5)-glutamine methyltransferase, partial [candidate division Zixibacteria bacterium]
MGTTLPIFISKQIERLEAVGIDQSLAEVEWILCNILEVDRLEMYLTADEKLDDHARLRFEEVMLRREKREPLQYILSESFFYGRKFFVSPAVMVPTPETEMLCQSAIGFVEDKEIERPKILDLGVGSGVISVTLACEIKTATVMSV